MRFWTCQRPPACSSHAIFGMLLHILLYCMQSRQQITVPSRQLQVQHASKLYYTIDRNALKCCIGVQHYLSRWPPTPGHTISASLDSAASCCTLTWSHSRHLLHASGGEAEEEGCGGQEKCRETWAKGSHLSEIVMMNPALRAFQPASSRLRHARIDSNTCRQLADILAMI